ncbi:protein of unknown function (plasmid) [Latilactobacillus sakei]|nr:protein of unknown function [Latilactobacillus sakei]
MGKEMVKNKSATRPGLTPEHKAENPVANGFCSLLDFLSYVAGVRVVGAYFRSRRVLKIA